MHIFCANANETHINRVNRFIETAQRTNAPCLGYLPAIFNGDYFYKIL